MRNLFFPVPKSRMKKTWNHCKNTNTRTHTTVARIDLLRAVTFILWNLLCDTFIKSPHSPFSSGQILKGEWHGCKCSPVITLQHYWRAQGTWSFSASRLTVASALLPLSDPFWKVFSAPWWTVWIQGSWYMNYIWLNVMAKCSGTDAQPISSFKIPVFWWECFKLGVCLLWLKHHHWMQFLLTF